MFTIKNQANLSRCFQPQVSFLSVEKCHGERVCERQWGTLRSNNEVAVAVAVAVRGVPSSPSAPALLLLQRRQARRQGQAMTEAMTRARLLVRQRVLRLLLLWGQERLLKLSQKRQERSLQICSFYL